MTKRENFEAIKAIVADHAELVAFVDKELELLDKRKNASTKAKMEKAQENAELGEKIVDAVRELAKPVSTMEIGTAVGISPQKATPILKVLVAEGKLTVKTEKRKNLYTVAE